MVLRITRILFPVDFSDRCAAIAGRVKALAEHFESEVVMIYALPPLPPHVAAFDMTTILPEAVATFKEKVRAELDRFLQHEFSHLPVRRICAEGYPADVIVQHAQALKADLILMPTQGLGVFRQYIIGSVTAKVLHDTSCPVWTGVHRATPPPVWSEIRHVVCAVDLGPQSVPALRWAVAFASKFQSKVTLLHIAPDLQPVPEHYFNPDWRTSLESWTRDELQKIQNVVGTDCEARIENGEASKGVVHAASALKADLLVIGRSPHDGLVGRLRANAYATISQSPCPVVSV
jgi:nucleotide-binding universal stress UspA family protein